MHVLFIFLALAKITNLGKERHLNYTSIFFYITCITHIFHR
jgi:hypothetical protein